MKTQGERLWKLCRQRARTYLDLMLTGISTAPHKRLAEHSKQAPAGEQLVRRKNARGLVTFRVVRRAT